MRYIQREGGINWEWYTVFEKHSDNTVTIIEHDRARDVDTTIYAQLPRFREHLDWKETENRKATHFGRYEIRNAGYIFGFRNQERLEKQQCHHGGPMYEDGSCHCHLDD